MRFVRRLCGFAALLLVAFVIGWLAARPRVPDAFYNSTVGLPNKPGVLLREEAFDRKVPAGARAWRILYTTTRGDGSQALASGIVMVSTQAQADPRPVIAWTHGTTGVVEGCAPSVIADPFANVPAVQPLLDKGWIFVATDYAGQGTTGPHAYLIGEDEARAELDAIRAARQLKGIRPGNSTVVWGHSQGGMRRCGPRSLRRPTRPMFRWPELPRSRLPATCGR